MDKDMVYSHGLKVVIIFCLGVPQKLKLLKMPENVYDRKIVIFSYKRTSKSRTIGLNRFVISHLVPDL